MLKVVGLEHTGSTRGGFVSSVPLLAKDAIGQYRQGLGARASSSLIFALRLDGRVERSSIQTLNLSVAAHAVVPASSTVVVAPAALGSQLIQVLDRQGRARPSGRGPGFAVISPSKKWMPQSGRVNAYEIPSRMECFLFFFNCRSIARGQVDHEFTWASADDIAAFGDDAYEHDFKLHNRDNPSDRSCFVWEQGRANAFWLTRNALTWVTTLPAATKPYLDTNALDACSMMDLTVGMQWPKLVSPSTKYAITVVADRGTASISEATVEGQRITKIGPWCDFSEWCPIAVNDFQLVVQQSDGRTPGCRDWVKDQQPSSVACP
jgi:hypothetical protein